MIRLPLVIVLAAAVLAGCVPTDPAPVERRSVAAPIDSRPRAASPRAAAPAAAAGSGEIIVPAGTTLFQIAEEQRVNLRALIIANDLRTPYSLSAGQRLVLPQTNSYTVQRGDTLYAIARRFSIQPRSLALLNGIDESATIRPGQTLVLPGPAGGASAPASASPTRTPSRGLFSGPPPRFAWPIEGQLLERFGPKTGGGRNDGINIAASDGQSVSAAAAGRVVFADVLEGYGRLILIQHADGWVSAYAHNRALLVTEEESVAQGQAIAEAGSTGAVDSPQLHFELRRDGSPVDPLTALPAG